MSEWISVKSRMPEHRGWPPVICGHSADKWSDAAIVCGGDRFFNSEGVEVFPTHWMPLPEPPGEDAAHAET